MHIFRGVSLVLYLCVPDPCTMETLEEFAKVISVRSPSKPPNAKRSEGQVR